MAASKLPLAYSQTVARARSADLPLVALESTVITHGLPFPENLNLARDMEANVKAEGAVPATIAILDGKIRVGLSESQLEMIATAKNAIKVSRRDFGLALARRVPGGTTVAG
ncbi:MAG: pseudouridine-5'-phosphate glycosidase, partial [Bellilinea sp.]